LRSSAAVLRWPAKWAHGEPDARLDEDWTLTLLGVVILVAVLALGAVAAWTAYQRDAALQNAKVTGSRLNAGGADERLYQDLLTMQQDEVGLFDARQDPGQAVLGKNPAVDLNQVYGDLTTLKAQFADSPQVQRDITLISQEMAPYTAAEASALDDNQQGLPVGGAYLRAASLYLTAYTLPAADNIRLVDQSQVNADDATASAVPWPLLAVAVIALACLIGAQILLARWTRCLFDPWLLLSTAVTVIITLWSVTAISVSADSVSSGTSPHAQEAFVLAQALVDGITAGNDDQLTLADHDEDCSATNFPLGSGNFDVTCSFEGQVVASLTSTYQENPEKGQDGLRAELTHAAADAPDQAASVQVGRALEKVDTWLTAENQLPTLQNLEAEAEREQVGSLPPRYNPGFEQFLCQYTNDPCPQKKQATPADSAAGKVTGDFAAVRSDIGAAIGDEWAGYMSAATGAGGTLNGAVTGAVLLALLAAAAGGLGIGLRVTEYWSPGGRAE
jgi:hypothetical protein